MNPLLLLGSILLVLTATGPLQAASFDCAKAVTDAQRTVCSDPELDVFDEKMGELINALREESDDPGSLRSDQMRWAAEAERCGSDAVCLKLSYARRFQELMPAEFSAAAPDEPIPEDPEIVGGEVEHDLSNATLPALPVSSVPETTEAAVATVAAQPEERRPGNPLAFLWLGGGTLAVVGVFVGIALATKALADHSFNKYGWPMIMNGWNGLHLLGFAAIAFFSFIGMGQGAQGFYAGLVVAAGLWFIVLVVNIRKTSLLTGLAITIVQPFIAAVMWILFGMARRASSGQR